MADNQHYVIDDGQNKIPGYTKTEVDELIESGAKAWSGTQAEYNALKQAGLLQPRSLYIITDAANLNGTAKDISYDGSTKTIWDMIENLENIVVKAITISITCRGYIRCFQLGKFVFVDININTDSNTTPIGTVIATGFPKPYESFYPRLLARDNNGSYAQILNFDNANGSIKTADTVMQGNTWWGCQYVYFTND